MYIYAAVTPSKTVFCQSEELAQEFIDRYEEEFCDVRDDPKLCRVERHWLCTSIRQVLDQHFDTPS